jgi:PAS domain S-box-containing protein
MIRKAAVYKTPRFNHLNSVYPYLALILLLLLSVLAWQYYKDATLDREEQRYNKKVDHLKTRIFEQINQNEVVLKGVAGVFAATDEVGQEEWSAYFEYQQIVTEHPGIRDAAFAKVVQPSELAEHLEKLRAEGHLEYRVWPEGERELYTPAVFVAPFTENYRAGLGFDLYSELVRRATMERARDSGAAAISGKMTIMTETGLDPPMGFVMVLPVYEKGAQLASPEERRAAIIGYVSSFFRIEELMAAIFSNPVQEIGLRLYDGTELSQESLLYDSHFQPEADHDRHPLFTSTETIDLYGHQWTMVFISMSAFEAVADRNSHWAILGAGLLISLLIFFYLKNMQQMSAVLRKSEEALQANYALLRIAGETAKFGGWSVDLSSNIVIWSDQVAEIHGLPADYSPPLSEAIDFYAPEWREKIAEVFTMCTEKGISYDEELQIITPKGQRVWVRAIGEAVRDESGKIIKAQGSFQDISEHKQDEAEIRKLNEELEQRVKERTYELEESNKELTAFAYAVSHDFRAPLRALNAFSANLTEMYGDRLDEKGLHYLDRIRKASLYMSELVDDLLQLSRIIRTDLKRQSIDISELARDIINNIKTTKPERQIKVKITPGLTAVGDFNLLKLALENLIDNAYKFSALESRPVIEVGSTSTEGEIAFFVRDNGVGFDMAYAAKLYGTFQRLHGADEFPGTGIGLATVQRIINRHGGRIWAESEVGKGATFYFTLGLGNR